MMRYYSEQHRLALIKRRSIEIKMGITALVIAVVITWAVMLKG